MTKPPTREEWDEMQAAERHCYDCHFTTPDVYEDGCCCCYTHRDDHGGNFMDPTVFREKVG